MGRSVSERMLDWKHRYSTLWPLFMGVLGLFGIFVLAICGYIFIEGWDFDDAFYMVVITLSTVGYGEVRPLSDSGRVLTAHVILSGVGGFAYLVGSFTQLLVDGRFQAMLRRRKVLTRINKLNDHFIVCGYGRIGKVVEAQIQEEGHPVVIIEKDPEIIGELEETGHLFIAGDATSDEVLLSAGLDRAKSLITALSQEAANVYVTLTARQFSPSINIIARADDERHISRLKHAGADRVVLPHVIGGLRMAQSVLRPTVTNFLDLTIRGTLDLQMEELPVAKRSELDGMDLMHSNIRPRFDVMIISIMPGEGPMIFNPGPKQVINGGDTLVAVGKPKDLERLRRVCSGEA